MRNKYSAHNFLNKRCSTNWLSHIFLHKILSTKYSTKNVQHNMFSTKCSAKSFQHNFFSTKCWALNLWHKTFRSNIIGLNVQTLESCCHEWFLNETGHVVFKEYIQLPLHVPGSASCALAYFSITCQTGGFIQSSCSSAYISD